MGLFSNKKNDKKIKKNKKRKGKFPYNENMQKSALTAFDNMIYMEVISEDLDGQLFKICDTILSGRAVLANFTKISLSDANRMLSFIAGVIYAREGEYFKTDTKMFLFACKEEFQDGSLYEYIEDTRS